MKLNKFKLGDRIRSLREDMSETQLELAGALGVKRQIISYYENGTRLPSLEHLMSIAIHYNTTTDYLLGISDLFTNDKDVQFICDYTGLSDLSVEILHNKQVTKTILREEFGDDADVDNDTATVAHHDDLDFEEYNYFNIKEEYLIFDRFISEGYFNQFLMNAQRCTKAKNEAVYYYDLFVNSFLDKHLLMNTCYREKAEFYQDKSDAYLFRIQQLVVDFMEKLTEKKDLHIENMKKCARELDYTLYSQIRRHFPHKGEANFDIIIKTSKNKDCNIDIDEEEYKKYLKTKEEINESIEVGEKYGYHKKTE